MTTSMTCALQAHLLCGCSSSYDGIFTEFLRDRSE